MMMRSTLFPPISSSPPHPLPIRQAATGRDEAAAAELAELERELPELRQRVLDCTRSNAAAAAAVRAEEEHVAAVRLETARERAEMAAAEGAVAQAAADAARADAEAAGLRDQIAALGAQRAAIASQTASASAARDRVLAAVYEKGEAAREVQAALSSLGGEFPEIADLPCQVPAPPRPRAAPESLDDLVAQPWFAAGCSSAACRAALTLSGDFVVRHEGGRASDRFFLAVFRPNQGYQEYAISRGTDGTDWRLVSPVLDEFEGDTIANLVRHYRTAGLPDGTGLRRPRRPRAG